MVVFTPIIGVAAIAMLWVAYLPYFVITHQYAKRKHAITMQLTNTIGSILLGLLFAGIMYIVQAGIYPIVKTLGLPDIIDAILITSLIIPFWYIFIASETITGLVYKKDLSNIESVFRIIPPAWWVSKPIIDRLSMIAKEQPSEPVVDTSQ